MSVKQQVDKPARIGLLAELTGPFSLAPLVEAAMDCLDNSGVETCVLSSGNGITSERRAWELLSRDRYDGLIVYSDLLSNDELARWQSNRRNTVIARIDNRLAGQLAATSLLKQGHQQIAMVTGPSHRFSVQHRSHGFVRTLNTQAEAGVGFEVLHTSELTQSAGRGAMAQLLASRIPPSGVFFHHETMAIGAMKLCRERLLKVPEDVHIVCCFTSPLAAEFEPAMCPVNIPLEDIGRFAAQQVLARIDSEKAVKPFFSDASWPAPVAPTVKSISAPPKNSAAITQSVSNGTLSDRERECLQWAAKGKTSWEISQILSVTESTVIYHLRNATRKLNAANRIHAVTKALQASLIEF